MNNTLRTYPPPLASYEEVVANKDLFMSTLKKLHSEMGTKFWHPKVRFGDLDLHKLFVEVTSRGGIEQIVREEKWNDVFDTFDFPKSQRNPIFTKHLRTHYYSLLHNYEIIYFFKARGQFPPLIGFVYGKIKSGYLVTFTMGSWKLEGVLYDSRVTQEQKKQSYDVFPNTLTDKANPQELFKTKSIQWKKADKQQKNEVVFDAVPLQQWPPKQNTVADAPIKESEEQEGYSNGHSELDEYSEYDFQRSPRNGTATRMEKGSDLMDTSSLAVPVIGVLDGIFESGYFATVTIGSEKLRGVMYLHQSPLLNTDPREKHNENEKAIYKEKAGVEERERCSREMEDHIHNSSDELKKSDRLS